MGKSRNKMHAQKFLASSPAGLGITKRGAGKPLRVCSMLCERDKSRNSKLATVRMAGAFVHWRQVGTLVFNGQLVSLRFTFQSLPFSSHLALANPCPHLSPYAPGNSNSLPWFFSGMFFFLSQYLKKIIRGRIIKQQRENLLSVEWHPWREKCCCMYAWLCSTQINIVEKKEVLRRNSVTLTPHQHFYR